MINIYREYNASNKNILKNIIASAIEESFIQSEISTLNTLKLTSNVLKISEELAWVI